MKFDAIIMGGGLAGLVCGIRLQESGRNCAIVSAGQSALHFSSGSFDLLGRMPDGREVSNPLEAVGELGPTHPYAWVGAERIARYDGEFRAMAERAGIRMSGAAGRNHYRLTPMGEWRPTWLTLDDFVAFDSPDAESGWGSAVVVDFPGFMDFCLKFVVDGLERRGVRCLPAEVKLPFLDRLRANPTEMRAPNIARVLEERRHLDRLLQALERCAKGADRIVLPAVFGLSSDEPVACLRQHLDKPVVLVPTIPPSVPGIRMQQQLVRYFVRKGGTFLPGDTALRGVVEADGVKAVRTSGLGDMELTADHYVLATGSLFSRGIVARPDAICEPIFGLDVLYDADRSAWCDADLLAPQNYMAYGVVADAGFRAVRKGGVLSNLHVVGSVLSGCNALGEGCGAGVAIMSAMCVADGLSKQK